jgi:hypothetical protein
VPSASADLLRGQPRGKAGRGRGCDRDGENAGKTSALEVGPFATKGQWPFGLAERRPPAAITTKTEATVLSTTITLGRPSATAKNAYT